MNLILVGVLIYVISQLAIGFIVGRGIKNESDYLLAGRRFGPVMLAMTVFATWFGAETCLGAAGEVYSNGLVGARLDPFGYSTCILLMGLFFAAILWQRKYVTLADLFRERYSAGVERLAVIILVPTSVLWAAAQIRAFGTVLVASSEISLNIAISISALVVVLYTTSGGLLADAITDFIQGIVLITGLFIIGGLVAFQYVNGNFQPVDPSRLSLFSIEEEPPLIQLEAWCIPIIGSLLSQELVSRILGAKSISVARNGTLMGAGIYLVVGMIPVFLGLLGPSILPELLHEEHEQFLPKIAQLVLPTFLYIIFIGALVSAILSTVDSALLAAGSLLSHNLLIPVLRTHDERIKVRISRISVFVFGIIAYYLALGADKVRDLVEEASALGSTGIFIVVMFGLFTRFGNILAAYLTLISGITSYLLASQFESDFPYLFSLTISVTVYITVGFFERLVLKSPILGRVEVD